jgi:CspA family cold shock protein
MKRGRCQSRFPAGGTHLAGTDGNAYVISVDQLAEKTWAFALQRARTFRAFSKNRRIRADQSRSLERVKGHSMATGTVKWFNNQKGFGFIQPENGGSDVFVHISAVERAGLSTLNEGQRISYDVVNERGKSAAANLKAA